MSRLAYLLVAVLTFATIMSGLYFFVLRKPVTKGKPDSTKYTVTSRPLFTATENRKKVTLFFPSASGFALVPVEREIYATNSAANQMKQIVVELIKGPDEARGVALAALPEATRLREIFMRDAVVYVDLTKELSQNLEGGSETELLTIYSLVDSLVYNFADVKRVKILIEGAEVETLAGHVDLQRPLEKDLGYVQSRLPGT
ncbi:MAG: GerMN domain-containing protein [Acidobacteriota bacterium]